MTRMIRISYSSPVETGLGRDRGLCRLGSISRSVRSGFRRSATDLPHPVEVGQPVRPELLRPLLVVAGEEGAVAAELGRGGRVEQVARIVRAHLEEHAEAEFLDRLAVEGALEVGEGIAPDDGV